MVKRARAVKADQHSAADGSIVGMSWGSVSSMVLPLANLIIGTSGQPDDYGQAGETVKTPEDLTH
jgi:hypothetical protein